MDNLNRIIIVLFEQSKTGKWLADKFSKSPCKVSKWHQNPIQPDLQTHNNYADLLKIDVMRLIVNNINKMTYEVFRQ